MFGKIFIYSSLECPQSIEIFRGQRPGVTSNDVSTISIETILKEIGLESLLTNFISEGLDFDMLVKLSDANLKECSKENGIKRFGDRHRIVERRTYI